MTRWLFFLRDLVVNGERIPAGATRTATADEAEGLRSLPGGERGFLDVTPKLLSLSVSAALGNELHARPHSSAILLPCPECTEPVAGQPGNFKMRQRVTRCAICSDKRTVVAPAPWALVDWSRGARPRMAA